MLTLPSTSRGNRAFSSEVDAGSREENASKIRAKENDMPLIEVHVIENVFNAEQKRQMISKLTDAMVSIEGEAMRGVTRVKISEVASGDWGIGGQSLTSEAFKDLAGRKAA
jgi:4-oxalocrotonate tautomerase